MCYLALQKEVLMLSRLLLACLFFIFITATASAEDPVAVKMKLIEDKQKELTLKEIKSYKSEIFNKIKAIDNSVSLQLGLWGGGGLALGALFGLWMGVKWKTREVEKIIEKEASDFREKIRKDVLVAFSSEDKELQNGLDTSIQKSIERIRYEQNSQVLVVTGEADNRLQELLPRLGFDHGKFVSMSFNQVFDYKSGATVPRDQDFDLVILDSLAQEDAANYVRAGKHNSYLLYKEGRYPDDDKDGNPHPYKIPRDRTIIVNSKPTLYGHVMTLLSFNKGI